MRSIFVVILMLIAVVLAVQNAEVAAISVFWWEIRASLAVILVVSFTLGALAAALVFAPDLYRRRVRERRLRERIATLEASASSAPVYDTPSPLSPTTSPSAI